MCQKISKKTVTLTSIQFQNSYKNMEYLIVTMPVALCASVDVILLYVLLGFHVDFPMHALHVARDMHLLFGAIYAVRTLELRFLPALPLLMVAEGGLELVDAAAVGAREAGLARRRRQLRAAHAHGRHERQRQPRRPLVPRQAPDPSERHVLRHGSLRVSNTVT